MRNPKTGRSDSHTLNAFPAGTILFPAILNTLEDALFLFDDRFKMAWYNKACDALYQSVSGKPLDSSFDFNELLTKEQQPVFNDHLHKVLTGGEAHFEWKYKGSVTKWLSVSLYPFDTGDEKVIGICGCMRDITEKKINELALLRNSALLNNISDAVIYTDLEQCVVYFNQSAEKIYGIRADEIKGRRLPEMISYDYLDDPEEHVLKTISEKGGWEGRIVHTRRDGKKVYLLASVTSLADRYGNAVGLIIASKDITKEELNRQESLRYQYHISAIINNIKEGVLLVGSDFTVLEFNQTAYTFEKRIDTELRTGENLVSLLPEYRKKPVLEYLELALKDKLVEYEVLYPDNTWLSIYFVPVKNKNGSIKQVCITYRDITEDKKIRQEMEALSLVAKETSNSVMIFDKISGRILWVNEGFTRLTGFNMDDITGKHPFILTGAETDKVLLKYMSEQIENDLPYSGDILIYTKNGCKRLHEVTGQPIKEADGRVVKYFAIGTDITDRRRLEEERIQKEIEQQREITRVIFETREAERNELGRELHDNINQILGAIKLQLSYCLTNYETGRPVIERSIKYVHEAIEEIRNLSHRMVMPSFSEHCLASKLSGLIAHYSFAQTIQLDAAKWNDAIIPQEIKETFYRVAQEQLTNIHKYAKADLVTIQLKSGIGCATMTVKDNGVGFDPEINSTGIGFTNIRKRAELYNGSTSIISAPGKGCIICVSIPFKRIINK